MTLLYCRARFSFAGAALLLAAALSLSPPLGAPQALAAASTPAQSKLSFLSRSNTIVERLHYLHVGGRIWARDPVFGSAPGAVDLYYGRYKPESARETKYLHNWVVQLGAELGITGVALALLFLGGMFWRALRAGALRTPAVRALAVMAAVFLFDALVELSFNSREMMMFFGVLCGALLFFGASPAAAGSGKRLRTAANAAAGVGMGLLLLLVALPWLLGASYRQRAEGAIELGEMQQARAHLERALFWTPRDPQNYLRLAWLARQEGGGAQAAAAMVSKALELNPQSASLHAEMSRLHLETGNLQQAQGEIERALELYPTSAEYHYQLARVHEKRGDFPQARKAATRAVELGHLEVERYRGYLRQLEKAEAASTGRVE